MVRDWMNIRSVLIILSVDGRLAFWDARAVHEQWFLGFQFYTNASIQYQIVCSHGAWPDVDR